MEEINPYLYSMYLYQKIEVTVTGLIPEREVQFNLFSKWNGHLHDKLSKVMDKINRCYRAETLHSAAEGGVQRWSMCRNFLNLEYTTRWVDIIKVR